MVHSDVRHDVELTFQRSLVIVSKEFFTSFFFSIAGECDPPKISSQSLHFPSSEGPSPPFSCYASGMSPGILNGDLL